MADPLDPGAGSLPDPQSASSPPDPPPASPAPRPSPGGRAGGGEPASVSLIWRAFAFLVTTLRYPVLLAWVVAAVAAVIFLPGITPAATLGGLAPSNSPALRAEYRATALFGEPLTSQVAVVQRDPGGFTRQAQLSAARPAIAVDSHHAPAIPGLAGAVPIANTGGIFPGSRERSTTIITFLYFRPGAAISAETAGGQAYARRYLSTPADHLVGVTGAAPAEAAQGTIILRYLPWVELATILAIVIIVGLHFRSLGAPLATLLCAGVVYLVAIHVIGWAAQRTGVTVPPDLEPVLVVLLLGVTTDYSVFYLAGMRDRLADGARKVPAARRATAEVTPIIVAAGLVVGLGAASLSVANLGPLRAFGPALAATVLVAMVVAITLAPALIAIFGGLLFHPLRARPRRSAAGPPGPAPAPTTAAGDAVEPPRGTRVPTRAGGWRARVARLATARLTALVVVVVCVAGLLAAMFGLRDLRLGFPLIRALPASSQPARAEAAAAKGFVPGILAPTEVLVLGPEVGGQRAALDRLQHALARRPGVAGVVGPADLGRTRQRIPVLVTRSGNAARFGVIMRSDPLGPTAIGQVQELQRGLPAMARAAGLTGARFEVGGETAAAGEAIAATEASLWRVALAIALVILVLLAVFLRSLIAPLYLLAASVLALLASLGLTAWIFQRVLGSDGLVYYVPFAVAVLLVSLGSDYNLFVVGRIWEEARRYPVRDAVATAVPRASGAITTAGLALAAGFAMLALVPLTQFREIAVAMVIGIVIDTFIVRTLLVPSLVVLSGRAGRWAGGRRPRVGTARRPVPQVAETSGRR
jgi:putative drug exporter of the RND superfamily